MGKIANLPLLDRPREKALRYGIEALSDQELLSIVLSNGYFGVSVKELSSSLLDTFGGLSGLSKTSILDLKKQKGISYAKSLLLRSIFEISIRLNAYHYSDFAKCNSFSLYTKYKDKLSKAQQEYLIVVGVNRLHHTVFERILYIGTSTDIAVSHKEIFRVVLFYDCYGFFLIHNHPGSDSSPSPEDFLTTKEIERLGKSLGVRLIDHIIIGENDYYSFKTKKKDEKT